MAGCNILKRRLGGIPQRCEKSESHTHSEIPIRILGVEAAIYIYARCEHVDLLLPVPELHQRCFEAIAGEPTIDREREAWLADALRGLSQREQRGTLPVDEDRTVAGDPVRKSRCRLPSHIAECDLEIKQHIA